VMPLSSTLGRHQWRAHVLSVARLRLCRHPASEGWRTASAPPSVWLCARPGPRHRCSQRCGRRSLAHFSAKLASASAAPPQWQHVERFPRGGWSKKISEKK
jgi:hypothetical protein